MLTLFGAESGKEYEGHQEGLLQVKTLAKSRDWGICRPGAEWEKDLMTNTMSIQSDSLLFVLCLTRFSTLSTITFEQASL